MSTGVLITVNKNDETQYRCLDIAIDFSRNHQIDNICLWLSEDYPNNPQVEWRWKKDKNDNE